MKRIAVLAVIAVGLAGLAVLAVPFLVSPDLLKARIADQISGAAGRPVRIGGEPSLSIYPHLAVSVGGLSIANPAGMGEEPFAAAETVTARLRVLPLFLGRIEFDAFVFVRPRFHLVADAEGRTNWRMPQGNDGAAHVASLALGRLQIVDGTIIYDDTAGHRHEEMTAVTVDLTWPSADDTAMGNGSLQWRGETVEFNGSVAKPVDLIAGAGSGVRFAIASTSLRVSFNGKAFGADDYHLEGDASVNTPSLRKVIAWLGTPMGTGSILGPASIEGKLSWLGSSMSFYKASLGLDGNEAQGVLALDFGGPRPVIQGTFAAAKLDLSPYMEAMLADMSADGPWPFAATRLPIANVLDCDLRFSAGELLVGAVRIDGLAATTTIKDGFLTANIGQARFYGGGLDARVTASMRDKTLLGGIRAQLTSVPALGPLKDLMEISALTGTANLSININGSGATWGELARSVYGSGTMSVANGTVTGIDLAKVATQMADPLAEPMEGGLGSTAFKRLTGTVNIASNVLTTDDLLIEGESYDVALNGRGSLLTGSLEAKAKLTVKKDGGGAPIPLAITGTVRKPLIAPDQTTLRDTPAEARVPRG